MTVRPDCLAIELGSDYIRWGAEFADRVLIRTIPVSDGELAGISADQRTGALTRKILTHIREREGIAMPDAAVITVPYLTFRDVAQAESVCRQMGIERFRVMKRISAFADAVSRMGLECGEEEFALVIDCHDMACETAIVSMGSGVTEMYSVVQRQITPETPMSAELLRKDIFKAIDSSGARKIIGVYVSDLLDAECRQMLKTAFHLEYTRVPTDSVLRGSLIACGHITGRIRDSLVVDATDYEICVGQDVLLDAGTKYPTSKSMEIVYHPARPDRCIDLYIRKNNMVLDQPLCARLSVEPLLMFHQKEQKLEVTVDIERNGRISAAVMCGQTGRRIIYDWEEIRRKLI